MLAQVMQHAILGARQAQALALPAQTTDGMRQPHRVGAAEIRLGQRGMEICQRQHPRETFHRRLSVAMVAIRKQRCLGQRAARAALQNHAFALRRVADQLQFPVPYPEQAGGLFAAGKHPRIFGDRA